MPIYEARNATAYFGRPHYVHLPNGCPEGFPEVHLVHRGAGDKGATTFMSNRTSSMGCWYCDSSSEAQPLGMTMLYVLEHPKTGGDTLFVDQAAAGTVKREPVVNEYPAVRTHPIIGEKVLFLNKSCRVTRSIAGYKKEESDALLKFLYDHIAYGADFQARVQ